MPALPVRRWTIGRLQNPTVLGRLVLNALKAATGRKMQPRPPDADRRRGPQTPNTPRRRNLSIRFRDSNGEGSARPANPAPTSPHVTYPMRPAMAAGEETDVAKVDEGSDAGSAGRDGLDSSDHSLLEARLHSLERDDLELENAQLYLRSKTPGGTSAQGTMASDSPVSRPSCYSPSSTPSTREKKALEVRSPCKIANSRATSHMPCTCVR